MRKKYMLNRIFNTFNKLDNSLFLESSLRVIFRWRGNPFCFLLSSHRHNNKSGLSLMELLVALPMLAFVFLGMGYMIATTGSLTAVDIAKVKTQIATNNVLMIIKAENYSKIGNILGCNISDPSSFTVYISKDSIVHPDGLTNLKLSVRKEEVDSNLNLVNENKVYVVTVTAPDFENIQTVVKTVL